MEARGISKEGVYKLPYLDSLCEAQFLNEKFEFIFMFWKGGLTAIAMGYTHMRERKVALSTAYCEGQFVCTR